MDGKLFNLSRLKARTKTSQISVVELQYADDNAIVATNESDLQTSVTAFADAYRRMGLTVNIKKTQVLYQNSPNQHPVDQPRIVISGETLECVDNFAYLGSHLSSNATIDSEVKFRIRMATAAFGKLRKRVFSNSNIRASTKIMMYRAVVITTLLYASETWTIYRRHIRDLEAFNQRSLRVILNIKWQDFRTNISVLQQPGCPSIE